eukprot:jgi/Ulvmu1/9019/UM005_0110.1
MISSPIRIRDKPMLPHQSRFSKQPGQHRARVTARAQDLDVQVFRFTLGIPGFDDANIPRVVGIVGGALLTVNHLMSASPVSDAQVRGEAIGACMALLLIALPSIEAELKQLGASQGRKAAAKEVAGAQSLFLYKSANENAARNLAWVSFACLRNSNTSSLLVVWKGTVQIARGAFATEGDVGTTDRDASLQQFQKSLDGTLQGISIMQALPDDGEYMPNRQAMREKGVAQLSCVAEGIQSAMLFPLADNSDGASFMLVLSEFERALGSKDQAWLRSVRNKVRDTCQGRA